MGMQPKSGLHASIQATHSDATVIDAASKITAAFIVIEADSEMPVKQIISDGRSVDVRVAVSLQLPIFRLKALDAR